MATFTTYPYTFTATSAGITVENTSDGFKLVIPAGMFAQDTSFTISNPVKKAFFLRSTANASFLASAGNYWRLTKNSAVNAEAGYAFTITLPMKHQFDQDWSMTRFSVYVNLQSTISEDDPGNWTPGTGQAHPATDRIQANYTPGAAVTLWNFMPAHLINGHTSYT